MDLLLITVLYLGAAVLVVPFAQRFSLGSVLGYILAGIVLGPLITELTGVDTHSIEKFAEFGVVMMLFLIGLELQPEKLWGLRYRLLGLGGLQVLLTTTAITGGLIGFGMVWQEAIVIGMILSLSSTAIVLQTLQEKGWLKTGAGRSAFSVLLMQDIIVIPMLAIIPLLVGGDVGSSAADTAHTPSRLEALPGWLQTLAVIAACLSIAVGGRYLVRPLLRYVAAVRVREIFTATALLVVTGVALLMQAVGLSAALGTFLAGVVLSDSEYRHELESDIDPFKGLLLGLFFISVGAGIDFRGLLAEPLAIIAFTAGLIVIKALILAVLAHLFRLQQADRALFSLSLAQAGEFAFVLIAFALGAGALGDERAAQLSLIVALSMLITPWLFMLYERVVSPRLSRTQQREADVIEEPGQVIVAGVGRFGQMVHRLLKANGYHTVVLDHDADHVEMLRRFGHRAYYGDATRPDLLCSAGIENAQLLVAALDQRERQLELVRHVRKFYPSLNIVARAIDRAHVYELRKAGAQQIVRELFGSALEAGELALRTLGCSARDAQRRTALFRAHDLAMLDRMQEAWEQGGLLGPRFIEGVRAHSEQLATLIAAESPGQSEQPRQEEPAR